MISGLLKLMRRLSLPGQQIEFHVRYETHSSIHSGPASTEVRCRGFGLRILTCVTDTEAQGTCLSG